MLSSSLLRDERAVHARMDGAQEVVLAGFQRRDLVVDRLIGAGDGLTAELLLVAGEDRDVVRERLEVGEADDERLAGRHLDPIGIERQLVG